MEEGEDAADKKQMKEYKVLSHGEDDVRSQGRPNIVSSSVVLHLEVPYNDAVVDVNSYNYEKEFLNYNPDITLPFAYASDDTFSVKPEEVESRSKEPPPPESVVNGAVAIDPPVATEEQHKSAKVATSGTGDCDTAYAVRVTSVLRDFERKSRDGDWPLSTSVACYWCRHCFDTPPIGLPVKAFPKEDGFYVTGCYCSIACAAASNHDSRDSHDTVCERHAMLSSLSRLLYGSDDIRVAPDWRALRMFGGYMDVEEFRAFSRESRVILANTHPMKSLTTQLEEVNEGNIANQYSFVPLDPVRIERGKQELSLKRNKPRPDYKNTLDHSMNVVIKARSSSKAAASVAQQQAIGV